MKRNEAELRTQVESVRVCARVDPAKKIRIVQALQANGECGPPPDWRRCQRCAGAQGSQYRHRHGQGQRIYDNIREFIKHIMASNSGEI